MPENTEQALQTWTQPELISLDTDSTESGQGPIEDSTGIGQFS